MAFGKKKQQRDEAAAPTAPEAAPDEPLDEVQPDAGVFAASGEGNPEEDAITAGLIAAEKAEAAADPLAGDLLNMFQTTKIEAEDLSVILELAGDVEIDDLLEELHTAALALGCQLEEVDSDDLLAA